MALRLAGDLAVRSASAGNELGGLFGSQLFEVDPAVLIDARDLGPRPTPPLLAKTMAHSTMADGWLVLRSRLQFKPSSSSFEVGSQGDDSAPSR